MQPQKVQIVLDANGNGRTNRLAANIGGEIREIALKERRLLCGDPSCVYARGTSEGRDVVLVFDQKGIGLVEVGEET